ncbi:hypothetical protein [Pandoraea pnomenusa]|uniref:hypothetical protein n=1 Tax=Pandoraea pnomenusa TaxID=93220 RepID=UPI0033403EAE
MSCGYEGPHFGAHYPDATCIDGYLWDLDSCDEPGGGLYVGGDDACPCCNTREYVETLVDMGNGVFLTGNARQRRGQLRKFIREVQAWAK